MKLSVKILCQWLGWHQPIDIYWYEFKTSRGRQPHLDYPKAKCARCGCQLLQDSQGNWFKSGMQE